MSQFPAAAPLANLQFLRSYSRFNNQLNRKETWDEVCTRTVSGLSKLGKYTPAEHSVVNEMQKQLCALPSGRWLWVGGTPWMDKPANYYGAYNCSSCRIIDWNSFGMLMELAMMGCGTGAVLENNDLEKLPKIVNELQVKVTGKPGEVPTEERQQNSSLDFFGTSNKCKIIVGDSRQGWASSYQFLLEISSNPQLSTNIDVEVDVRHIRPEGELLKGFGGVANPCMLPELYVKVAKILHDACGRRLNSVECCLLIDEAALVVVSGNIRRSAGMRQFSANDSLGISAKDNLWQKNAEGQWHIDAKRSALRMANHTRVFHEKPTLNECKTAVERQFHSGEGALMWAGEAKKRAKNSNAYGLNPCGEIIGSDFLCNLAEVHLSQIDPHDFEMQEKAFTAATLSAVALLNHKFSVERFRVSREEDPIIGISFTGAFTFFVKLFGVSWLEWWQKGRPSVFMSDASDKNMAPYFLDMEAKYLVYWKEIVEEVATEYCTRHDLKVPNRCTTVQPAGSKTLLTGVGACGWHPPKGKWYIRRMTFAKNHPVALAALDYGYTIFPASSEVDENGCLLNDPYDSRVKEWVVEVPVAEPWANLEGAENIFPESFPVTAQWDFYMQIQKNYTTHNTSGTFEIFAEEIDTLATLIHKAIENDEGYISCAVLSRSLQNLTFPRLPFEPISNEQYIAEQTKVLLRRKSDDFMKLYLQRNGVNADMGPEDSACSGLICELKPLFEKKFASLSAP